MGSRHVNIVLPTTATPNDQDLSTLTLLNHLLYARVGIDFHREEVVETVHFGGFLSELLGKGIGQVVCWVGGLWALARVGVKTRVVTRKSRGQWECQWALLHQYPNRRSCSRLRRPSQPLRHESRTDRSDSRSPTPDHSNGWVLKTYSHDSSFAYPPIHDSLPSPKSPHCRESPTLAPACDFSTNRVPHQNHPMDPYHPICRFAAPIIRPITTQNPSAKRTTKTRFRRGFPLSGGLKTGPLTRLNKVSPKERRW
jgi:hypothetical protein